jgi:hypothetical protein
MSEARVVGEKQFDAQFYCEQADLASTRKVLCLGALLFRRFAGLRVR